MPNRFRAIAFDARTALSIVYHPKIRAVKAEAVEDMAEMKKLYPNKLSTAVIIPGEPFWKED